MRYTVDTETKCWASIEIEAGDLVVLHAGEFFDDERDVPVPYEDTRESGWNCTARVWMTRDEAVELATAILNVAMR